MEAEAEAEVEVQAKCESGGAVEAATDNNIRYTGSTILSLVNTDQ
jgi:hypothetical protein